MPMLHGVRDITCLCSGRVKITIDAVVSKSKVRNNKEITYLRHPIALKDIPESNAPALNWPGNDQHPGATSPVSHLPQRPSSTAHCANSSDLY